MDEAGQVSGQPQRAFKRPPSRSKREPGGRQQHGQVLRVHEGRHQERCGDAGRDRESWRGRVFEPTMERYSRTDSAILPAPQRS